jgi:protein-L-isoaspartate(D-aspartate) O-methyltransferase
MAATMDVERARFNMVEQQIRTWEVLDQAVLDLLFRIKREEYVPEKYRALAFADLQIPLGSSESMLAPKVEARILQELAIKASDRVLEIGTGSGYMTALLAAQGQQVVSVEIAPELAQFGKKNLAAHQVENVILEVGDAARGWSKHGRFEVIVLTGSTPVLPQAFLDSLQPGGRLFAVVGEAPVMKATLYNCAAAGAYAHNELFETVIPPLRNALQPERFVF